MPKSTNRKGSKSNEARYPTWEKEPVETILGKAGTLSKAGLRFIAERINALAAVPAVAGGGTPAGLIPAVSKNPKPKVAAVQQNTPKTKVWDDPIFDGLPCAMELRGGSREYRSSPEGQKALSLLSSATALLARCKAIEDPPIFRRKWKKLLADGSVDSFAHIMPKPSSDGSVPDGAMDLITLRSILASKTKKRKSPEGEGEANDEDA